MPDVRIDNLSFTYAGTSKPVLRELTLPSPGVPNLAFSPDEKTVYVTALDQLDKSPYRGKVYSVANDR